MWKTSKDRLIDFLQAEIEYLRLEVERQSEIAAEAVSLSSEMIKMVPESKAKSEALDPKTGRPRSMSSYLQELTDRSRKRALAGNNLVAKMQPPAGVKVAGN